MKRFKNPKKLYTDGSCIDVCYGGYAIVENHEVVISGFKKHTTNNRMELFAVIQAIKYANQNNYNAIIYSDSEYVVKGVNGWSKNWVKNGWKTANNKPVKNQDLWILLLNELKTSPNVRIVWVKAHGRNRQNNQADKAAIKAARKCKSIELQNIFENFD